MANSNGTGNPPGKLIKGKVLNFKLEDADRLALGAKAAQLDGEIEEIRTELKEASAEFKQRLKERKTELQRILTAVRTGVEEREADAVMVRNADGNTVAYWVDGRLVEERAMTFEERQEELGLGAAKAEAMGKAAPAPGSVKKKRAKAGKDEAADQGKREEDEDEIGNVRKLETSKRTKRSAVDGVYTDSSPS